MLRAFCRAGKGKARRLLALVCVSDALLSLYAATTMMCCSWPSLGPG